MKRFFLCLTKKKGLSEAALWVFKQENIGTNETTSAFMR